MTNINNDPNNTSPYNYPLPDGRRNAGPTEWICILMIVLFSISTSTYSWRAESASVLSLPLSTVAHTAQSILGRLWFLIVTIVVCGLGEILGWSGRLWSSINPPLDQPFQIQISTTIISYVAHRHIQRLLTKKYFFIYPVPLS